MIYPYKKPTLGAWGEKVAANYLAKLGFEILERNYTTNLGELDLIAKEGGVVVFVEVKTRTSRSFGLPQESVNFKKQNKIVRVALQYLQQHRLSHRTWRIDVVAIVMNRRTHKVENIELIRNAVTR
ncbi:MAG TPA: YraN family protein [Patescibacteria group bacterium]|nr:YraN family protein [Patescibacteria group bacterium]